MVGVDGGWVVNGRKWMGNVSSQYGIWIHLSK